MIWEAYRQTLIAGTEHTADNAEAKVDRFAGRVDELQRHVDRLSLACQAMWELLCQCSDVTEKDLEQKILEIDGRDGSVDGKMGVQQLDCPSCGRKTNSNRTTCLMCGAPIKRPSPFA